MSPLDNLGYPAIIHDGVTSGHLKDSLISHLIPTPLYQVPCMVPAPSCIGTQVRSHTDKGGKMLGVLPGREATPSFPKYMKAKLEHVPEGDLGTCDSL